MAELRYNEGGRCSDPGEHAGLSVKLPLHLAVLLVHT